MAADMNKKAVMIIAHDGFRDEELYEPKKVLEDAGVQVRIASSALGEAKGKLGSKAKVDILARDIKTSEYDAIILVGGPGASEYWEDTQVHKILRDAYNQEKVIAAICIAPVTLAKAGLLKGRKATVFPSETGELKANGAAVTAGAVQTDGRIVTANGPAAATDFGKAIVNLLK